MGRVLGAPGDTLADPVDVGRDPVVLVDAAEPGDDLRVVLVAFALFRGWAKGAGLGDQPGTAGGGGLAGDQRQGAEAEHRVADNPGYSHRFDLPCRRIELTGQLTGTHRSTTPSSGAP